MTLVSIIHTSTLWAQDSNIIDFRVIQLAANQVYFEAGNQMDENEVPVIGDTLYIFRESQFLGTMNVMAVSSTRIVAIFLDDTFLVTRGEYVTVKWNINQDAKEQVIQQKKGVSDDIGKTSILNQPGQMGTSMSSKKRTKISGRILTMANLTESNTRWSRVLNKSDTRWSSVPSTNLTLRVQQLPGDWDINLNGRYSYRMQTNSRINNTSILNIYNLNAVKKWEGLPLEIHLGRFHNRYETNYSYWDGAMIQLNFKNVGGGISAGFEPRNSNEGIQSDFKKLGGFFHYQMRNDNFRYRGEMSVTSVFPNEFSTQLNAGLEQRIDYKWLSLDGNVQVDKAPDTGIFELTRLRVRTGFEITQWFQIRAHYQKRTPYSYQYGNGIFFNTREDVGVNTTIKFGNWWFNNGVSINERVGRNTRSYDSRIQWYRSPVWDLSWSLYGSYWESSTGSSLNGGLSASKTFNDFRATAGATLYQVSLSESDQLTGGFFFNGSKTINQSLSLSVRLQSSISQLMYRNSVSFSLWKTF